MAVTQETKLHDIFYGSNHCTIAENVLYTVLLPAEGPSTAKKYNNKKIHFFNL